MVLTEPEAGSDVGAGRTKARDVGNGSELWVTDGTSAGTTLLQDLEPGPRSSLPRTPVLAGCRLFFVADTIAAR